MIFILMLTCLMSYAKCLTHNKVIDMQSMFFPFIIEKEIKFEFHA